MENNTNSLNSFGKEQAQDTKIHSEFEYEETTIRRQNKMSERVVLNCSQITFIDGDQCLQTRQGVVYKATITNGVLSFNKPLKFDTNGK
ncbi:hypothetical protein [Cellulophaga sp. Hel_I_12]|uniref:hypothetical protein n=1 Tax=Cellulophaga sp. Hel_I_12 TaxID=1249972 RepID=UPI0012E0413B|nr:hypothetical protein [Cellulophaga sp. Hel_I_12]